MRLKLNAIVLCLVSCQAVTFLATGQGTAFTYQGRLSNGANSANGTYDLTFALFNASSGGSQAGITITNTGLAVSNGLFTVELDFGTVFSGAAYWLELGVRTNGASLFTILSPRQSLTPTPYAVFAEGANAAGLSGTVPAGDLGGTYGNAVTFNNPLNHISGNGSGLTGVNASTVDGFGANQFWHLGGNAGTTPGVNFLGTTDNQGLDLASFGQRGLQLQYVTQTNTFLLYTIAYAMNMVGGYWGNTVSNGAVGATIAGGGELFQLVGVPGTSYPNVVTGNFGTIGGGYNNTAGPVATIPGGSDNMATAAGSFAAGKQAQALHSGAFVWSDGSGAAAFASTGINQFCVRALGGIQLDPVTSMYFGSQVRQMLNLWGAKYGIGVQSYTLYSRSDGDFAWYNGGAHSDNVLDPGPGGVSLMTLDSSGNLFVSNNVSMGTLTIRGGADLAEPFDLVEADVAKGSVVIIDPRNPGKLKLSDQPYDKRVAGVVSGANGVNPGISLRQEGAMAGAHDVALSGRVYVRAAASNGPIEPGDLLTTSALPGVAMKVTDFPRAQGAALGKAMGSLKTGEGLVLVLVTTH